MEAKGIIRKISVGDIKEGITYKVGQSMFGDRIMIEQIMQDLKALELGILKYDIYISENGSNNVRLWKEIENMPIVKEYDVSVVDEI